MIALPHMRRMRSGSRHGFTLLELLMVVIIIAILAAIAVPSYFRTAERSRAAEALQILATIRQSQLRYYNQYVAFTADPAAIDFTIPTSFLWTFSLDVSGKATATRAGTGDTITSSYLSGNLCTSNPSAYGLPASC